MRNQFPFEANNAEAAKAVAEALGFTVSKIARQAWDEYQHLKLQTAELVGELTLAKVPLLRISDLQTKRTTSRPSAPFTTASLQQAASTRLGYSASRTMRWIRSWQVGTSWMIPCTCPAVQMP